MAALSMLAIKTQGEILSKKWFWVSKTLQVYLSDGLYSEMPLLNSHSVSIKENYMLKKKAKLDKMWKNTHFIKNKQMKTIIWMRNSEKEIQIIKKKPQRTQ